MDRIALRTVLAQIAGHDMTTHNGGNMDEIKIEKGIPIPPITRAKWGFAEKLRGMKKGESVLLKGKQISNRTRYGQMAFGKGNYATRKEGDGYRIWRTK